MARFMQFWILSTSSSTKKTRTKLLDPRMQSQHSLHCSRSQLRTIYDGSDQALHLKSH